MTCCGGCTPGLRKHAMQHAANSAIGMNSEKSEYHGET